MADHHSTSSHDSGHGHGDDGGHDHAHGGVGKYVLVFIALLVLTLISFAVGNSESLRHNAPGTMWAMMMAVSCAKAMLVILFFMHMLWEANWKYVLTIPASMMSLFLLLMLIPDVGRRTDRYSEERWLYSADPKASVEETAGEHGKPASEHDHSGHGSGEAKH